MTWAPWYALYDWSPFQIDALGLVTLLGAEEVNSAVGRLVSSAYVEYLPFLGAFVIAGNRFTEKAAGFNLYNISQGIHTTDLAAWLTRWMLSQNFEVTRSFVVWKVTPPRSRKKEIAISLFVSVILNGFLVVMTVLSKDWYGFANAMSMIVSIIVRAYVIGQQRAAVDHMVDQAVTKTCLPDPGTYEAQRFDYKSYKLEKKLEKEQNKTEIRNRNSNAKENQSAQSIQSNSSDPLEKPKQASQQTQRTTPPLRPDPKEYTGTSWSGRDTKVLIIQSDSKAVTFWMPNELLIPPSVFIEGPAILHPKRYLFVRSIGWIVFAVHIVAIGMADLASQMYTVALLVLPTILLVLKAGCDDSTWLTTMTEWSRKILHRRNSRDNAPQFGEADDTGEPDDFRRIRECWIGSRLKAEIHEWPASYEFKEEVAADGSKKWTTGVPKGKDRSKKRQDLYAWLALTRDEEESMDKWDLFPHIRKGNTTWWETYKHKRISLNPKRNKSFGPQYIPEQDPATTSTTASDGKDPDPSDKPYRKPDRTATWRFIGDNTTTQTPPLSHKGGSIVQGSSAFPALTDHEQHKADDTENDDEATSPPQGIQASTIETTRERDARFGSKSSPN